MILQIHLFGHLRLFVDGQPHKFTVLPKTHSLLAYLLLHRDAPLPRENLAYLLWDDVPESEARANLRRHLYDLTQALPATADTPWLLRAGPTVQWNPDAPVWLDVAAFETLCRQNDRLTEAVALYTGDLLTDLYEPWLFPERERLRELYLATLMQLVQREWQRGDRWQAIGVARQLLSYDPAREDVLRLLLRLHSELGDRAGAMQAYQRFEERLWEELAIRPLPETQAVYEAIVHNQPLPDAPPAPATGPQAGPAAAPAVPSPGLAKHNLPAALNRFVGRDEELTAVMQMLHPDRSATRLLTITGPGGTGKTRLALEAARRLSAQSPPLYRDGIYFIPLAAITGAEQMRAAIAAAIAEQLPDCPADGRALDSYLQGRHLLLILDNFEHLLEAADLVHHLLTAVPHLRILVTSQSVLHLYGEQEFPLPPLPVPNLEQLPPLAEWSQFAAIMLFVERAQAVQPDFALTLENCRPVAEICTRLDGLPLALELAAARIKLFSPDALLAQLGQRFNLLVSQARNLPARQQTLRKTIDWSYNLLAAEEQSLFRVLSLFATSFTLEAVTAVAGDDPATFDLLVALVEKSMVRQQTQPSTGQPRFRLLQSLREYGQEKLAAQPEAGQVALRFAAYYADLAEEAEKGLRTSELAAWLQRLALEDGNFTAALNWSLSQADTAAQILLASRLVNGMERFWTLRGRISEIRLLCDRLLPHVASLPHPEEIRLLNKAGGAAQLQGDFERAFDLHFMALERAQKAGDIFWTAHTYHYLGNTAGRQGDYAQSRHYLSQCLAAYRQLPGEHEMNLSAVLNNLAIVHKRLGEYDEAVQLLLECKAIKEALQDWLGLAGTLVNLGNLALLQGDMPQAASHTLASLKLRLELGDRPGLILVLGQLAELAVTEGAYGRATRLFAVSDTWRQRLNLPLTADARQDYDQALAQAKAALPPQAFQAAWEEGARMTLPQAADYALAESGNLVG